MPNVRPSKPNFIGPPRSIYIEWLIGSYLLAIWNISFRVITEQAEFILRCMSSAKTDNTLGSAKDASKSR